MPMPRDKRRRYKPLYSRRLKKPRDSNRQNLRATSSPYWQRHGDLQIHGSFQEVFEGAGDTDTGQLAKFSPDADNLRLAELDVRCIFIELLVEITLQEVPEFQIYDVDAVAVKQRVCVCLRW